MTVRSIDTTIGQRHRSRRLYHGYAEPPDSLHPSFVGFLDQGMGKKGKKVFKNLRRRSKLMFFSSDRPTTGRDGPGTCRSAWSWAYSAAVSGLPSMGDRALVIISARSTSSGVS